MFFGVLLFLSELALWIGFGRWTYSLFKDQKGLAVFLGIVSVVVFILVWAFFFAPKADYRVSKLPRTVIIALISVAIGYGLYKQGDKNLGLSIMIGATVMQAIGQYFMYED